MIFGKIKCLYIILINYMNELYFGQGRIVLSGLMKHYSYIKIKNIFNYIFNK